MKTTDEIMAMAMQHRHAKTPQELIVAHAALNNSVNELVEQAKWAHHTPKLLTEADAAADLAGVPRPGAEPVAWVYQNTNTDTEYLVWKRSSGGRNWRPLYTTPPQASQPEARPDAEPVAYSVTCNGRHVGNVFSNQEKAAEFMREMNRSFPQDSRSVVTLVAPPQASQPLTDDQWQRIADTLDCFITRDAKNEIEAVLGIGAAQKGKP